MCADHRERKNPNVNNAKGKIESRPYQADIIPLKGSEFPRAEPQSLIVKPLARARTRVFNQEHYDLLTTGFCAPVPVQRCGVETLRVGD